MIAVIKEFFCELLSSLIEDHECEMKPQTKV